MREGYVTTASAKKIDLVYFPLCGSIFGFLLKIGFLKGKLVLSQPSTEETFALKANRLSSLAHQHSGWKMSHYVCAIRFNF